MQRLFSLGVAGMLIVALLAACGGDGDDAPASTPTTASSAATATTAPGSGDDPTATSAPAEPTATAPVAAPSATSTTAPATATTAPPATATSAPEPTASDAEPTTPSGSTEAEERLFALLLSHAEVGEQWIEQYRRRVEGDGSVGICGTPPFPRRDEKLAHVEVRWQTADGNKLAAENIVEFPDDVLDEAMEYVHSAFNCTEWTDELGTVSTVGPWDDPALATLGDDRQGAIVTIPSGGLMVDLYVIFVRTGNLITQLGYADVLSDPATAAADAAAFAIQAIEKVE